MALVAHALQDGASVDAGLLLLRVVVGLLVLGHAVQKSAGWLGGEGLAATAAIFDRVGYRPGRPMVVVASVSETAGAVLLITGLATPLAGAVIAAVMVVACSVHWPYGVWAAQRGFELPLTFGVAGAALALVGPGGWSLDAALDLDLPAWSGAAALAVCLAGAAALVAVRAVRQQRRPS
ncbi:DoxX family protein [Pimelobacter simplex]|uniref:DoxX family protein n=1 Tax=Nocardioides simplex TaxID=2045 RepID=UPI00366EC8D3